MNQTNTVFPLAWLWFVDELIPSRVKAHYSPKETWRNKPFSREDARFFFKGIEELSELFTEERSKGMPPYFQHPKYRSSYLLYFLPLQMAKFLTLFDIHSTAIAAALDHGWKTGKLKVVDLGAGPGTASLSLLLLLLGVALPPGKELPLIELTWFDTNKDIMEDGKALVDQLASQFPKLRGKVSVQAHVLPWWKAHAFLPHHPSLIIFGHVLNESHAPQRDSDSFWREILEASEGAGILMVEPASRKSAQTLSHHRDWFFESEWLENSPKRIWGPCLHSGRCPLAEGRDWCHFSFPTQISGQWFKYFSEGLGSERHWVKFSYLWVASSNYPSPKSHPSSRRVISDPLSQSNRSNVLICEPEKPGRYPISARSKVKRGDILQVK